MQGSPESQQIKGKEAMLFLVKRPLKLLAGRVVAYPPLPSMSILHTHEKWT